MQAMRSVLGFLRSFILAVVTAAVFAFLLLYLVDLTPELHPDLQRLATLVRAVTAPVITWAGATLGAKQNSGVTNFLPLGLAFGSLIFGGILVSFLRSLERTLSRPLASRAAPARSRMPAPTEYVAALPDPVTTPAPEANVAQQPVTSTAYKPSATRAPLLPAGASVEGTTTFTTMNPGGRTPIAAIPQPKRIGRYEVIGELGRGAMGVVYKARDPQIGRLVAIKSILGGVAGDSATEDFKRRFFSEARAAGRLNHPGIMKVHDLIEDDAGRPCLVLEFFEGRTLDKLQAESPPDLGTSLKILTQAAQALAFAHDNGVVHRDIKPGNIMVSPKGHTVIADFGIAKMEDVNLTATGTIMGTPAYMSPEQVQGLAVDHRSDIFSLGTVLYWLLTGVRPFAGSTFTSIAYNVVHTQPQRPTETHPQLPGDVEAVLDKCLAKSPMDRYATAHELAMALRGIKYA